jgi:hypothetical protein
MSDELKERNILKLILIVRFSCATLAVGHPIAIKAIGCSLVILVPDFCMEHLETLTNIIFCGHCTLASGEMELSALECMREKIEQHRTFKRYGRGTIRQEAYRQGGGVRTGDD